MSENASEFEFPEKCPVCGGCVVQESGQVARRCINSLGCPAQLIGELEHFVSRKGFDIDGLGEKQLENLKDMDDRNIPSAKFIKEFYFQCE